MVFRRIRISLRMSLSRSLHRQILLSHTGFLPFQRPRMLRNRCLFSEKICMICRDYEVCAKLLYLDKNEKELYILNLGKAFYCFKKYDLPIECEGGHEIFVFRDNIVYNHEMKILSPRFFELKGLKELIRLKKIYKIKITLKKVLLDWEYTCTKRDFKKREDINETKIEGKYEFDIGKTYFVNVEYEKKVNNEDLKVIK